METLDSASRQVLLRRARAAIASAIGIARPSAEPEAGDDAAVLARRAGAFVTLKVGGDLRGCIGNPEPELPLLDVVERCAVSAAVSDPRFPAVTADEWPLVELEISVLGPLERVVELSEIEVGRHGLIVEMGPRRGLLLPQVAVEWNWDRAQLVAHTCVKAGLSRDAWDRGAILYRFEADVFGEAG
jgi:AmmeMemoRadiSam system protein A